MRLRIKGAWILAGLAAVGVTLVHGQVQALGGMVVTSGSTLQTGDPTYEYLFTIDLTAGSTLDNGGFITLYDLPGIPAGALTAQPSIKWGSSVQLLGVTPSDITVTDSNTLYNVTWQWNGSAQTAGTSDEFLGTFIIGSTTELPNPPTPLLIYVASLDGVTASNEGTIQVNFIPEPSSVILLLAGAGMVPLLYLRERRRHARQNQSQLQAT